ncbi:MAG TPA: malate synthase A, partial [Chloroflexota bacterium]|nr:malate synthase A [Chloroflexota bacterium]
AEISRSQVWQWVHHGAALADGGRVTRTMVEDIISEEMDKLQPTLAAGGRLDTARQLFEEVALSEQFVEFLTLPAYGHID